MPSLGGLNDVAKGNVEIPSDVINRVLLKDETVVGQFDVFFPEDRFSPKTQFYLTVFSLGLWQVILFFVYLVRLLRHALCACKECADSVYFRRGKLIVTSRGRIVCWETTLRQSNSCLDRKTYHHVTSKTQIFHVDDVAQTSLSYSDRQRCLNCCCHDYSTGIDVSFYRYNTEGTWPRSPFLATSSPNHYISTVMSATLQKFEATRTWLMSAPEKQCVTVRITSNPDDHIYDGEYALEPLEDLTRFHQYLNDVLTNSRMEYYFSKANNTSATSRGFEYPNPGTVEANPPVFLSIKAATDLDQLRKFGDESGTAVTHGVKEIHPDMSNFSLVDEDGNVTVPKKWVPLSPGEEIVCAVGFGYAMTSFDYFLSTVTLGWYYFRCLRAHVIRRSAYILTTHRIVELLLVQKKGKVPAELGSMDMFVRSYFPKEVLSGSILSRQGGLFCTSSLLTSHGTISLQVPSSHFYFAQKMQLATSRYAEVPIADISDLEAQQINDVIQTSPAFQEPDECIENNPYGERIPHASERLLDHSRRKYLTDQLTSFEKLLYPMLPSETLLTRFQSGAHYLPFLSYLLCPFFNEHPNSSRWVGLVNLVRCLTCCRRPLLTVNASVVTNHTFFYTSTTETLQHLLEDSLFLDKNNDNNVKTDGEGEAGDVENNANKHSSVQSKRGSARRGVQDDLSVTLGRTELNSCGTCCGPASRFYLDPFVLVWVPVHALRSQQLSIVSSGAKPFAEKLLCCELESRSFQSRYVLNVDTKLGLSFNFAEDFPYKAWIKDRRLAKFHATLGAIQTYSHSHSHPNF